MSGSVLYYICSCSHHIYYNITSSFSPLFLYFMLQYVCFISIDTISILKQTFMLIIMSRRLRWRYVRIRGNNPTQLPHCLLSWFSPFDVQSTVEKTCVRAELLAWRQMAQTFLYQFSYLRKSQVCPIWCQSDPI